MRAAFEQLHDFGHYLLLCLSYAGENEQVGVRTEKPSESVIEDKRDVLVSRSLVLLMANTAVKMACTSFVCFIRPL